jgi:carbonic anhydrase/acetyltransferase-like protein (isoleucine patch superfamily)
VVEGAVTVGAKSSIWPCAVLRGDIEPISVGQGTNIQDGAVVHVADGLPARIGDRVTVGHLAMIHACEVGDECLIGMHATLLDGCKVGARSIVGAGALVTKGTVIPPGSLVLGSPAKVVRALSAEEQAALPGWAEKYIVVAEHHVRWR